MTDINVVFGALALPLYKQLRLPRSRCTMVQKQADAITLLKIGQLISESHAHTARKHLMRRLLHLKNGYP